MEDVIIQIFESWGFQVEKIEEDSKDQSPDFLVEDASSIYLVELKERGDDLEKSRKRDETLNLGELYSEDLPLVPKNRLSGIIKKAQSQLKAKEDLQVDFRLVWLAAIGRDQGAKYEQFFATLYGSTNIVDIDSTDGLKQCYFFKNSDFFRFREVLDGAILSWGTEALLCLNPYSPRFEQFKESELCQYFGKAVRDPIQLEKAGLAYVVDSDVDRSNEVEVLDFLIKKYSKEKIMNIDMGYHSATVAVPHK